MRRVGTFIINLVRSISYEIRELSSKLLCRFSCCSSEYRQQDFNEDYTSFNAISLLPPLVYGNIRTSWSGVLLVGYSVQNKLYWPIGYCLSIQDSLTCEFLIYLYKSKHEYNRKKLLYSCVGVLIFH